MRAIGLDMSTIRCGWAFVRYFKRELTVESFGAVESKPNRPLLTRLQDLHTQLREEILSNAPPDDGLRLVAVIENGFQNRNIKTGLDLAMTRGMAFSLVLHFVGEAQNILLLQPTSIRASLGFPSGKANKQAVAKRITALTKALVPAGDEADAVAAAIAGLIGREALR